MRRLRGDTALAAAVLAFLAVTALTTGDSGGRPLMPFGWALIGVAGTALVWRQRFPLPVLLVTAVVSLAYYPLGFPGGPILLTMLIALHTVARDHGPALSIGTAGPLALALCLLSDEPLETAVGVVPLVMLPVVLGEVARTRARQTAQAVERAALAEATRESEALRRAAEERLRIARELHDILGHQLSLISVQAGAALHTRETDTAFDALQAIRTASGEALREIRSVLGMLREPAASSGVPPCSSAPSPPRSPVLSPLSSPRSPTPSPARPAALSPPGSAAPSPLEPGDRAGLAALPGLFRRTGAAGLTVHARVESPDRPQPWEHTAYRIVQEALTNVVRHSTATDAHVTVRHETSVVITVDDDGDVAPAAPPGNGLRGMAERAATAGGDLEAGPRPGGGYRVQARLPLTTGVQETA